MRIPTGWFIFCCSHFLPRPEYSEFASGPREAIGVLPAAVSRNAGPDLTANCIHRPTGFRPIHLPTSFHPIHHPTVFCPIRPTTFRLIHSPTALSCIRTIAF